MYVCTCLLADIHESCGGQGSLSGVFLNRSTLFSEVGLLATQGLINLTRLAGPQVLDLPVFRPHPSLALGFVCCHSQLFTWIVGDLNSRPHACVASTLPIESHPQGLYKTLNNIFWGWGYSSVSRLFTRHAYKKHAFPIWKIVISWLVVPGSVPQKHINRVGWACL